jgi:hypothetical protein
VNRPAFNVIGDRSSVFFGFGEDEAQGLRDLLVLQHTPSNAALQNLGGRSPGDYDSSISRWRAQILDPTITLQQLV